MSKSKKSLGSLITTKPSWVISASGPFGSIFEIEQLPDFLSSLNFKPVTKSCTSLTNEL